MRHCIGRHSHRLRRKVRIARRGLDLRVAEELADHRKALILDGRKGAGVTLALLLEPIPVEWSGQNAFQ
jgi:hypothetical protein